MSTDITTLPALTPEGWQKFDETVTYYMDELREEDARAVAVEVSTDPTRPHECAALCLYGQPFGFTPEMVSALRDAAELLRARLEHFTGYADEGSRLRNRVMWCDAVADRLAALLPPPR